MTLMVRKRIEVRRRDEEIEAAAARPPHFDEADEVQTALKNLKKTRHQRLRHLNEFESTFARRHDEKTIRPEDVVGRDTGTKCESTAVLDRMTDTADSHQCSL